MENAEENDKAPGGSGEDIFGHFPEGDFADNVDLNEDELSHLQIHGASERHHSAPSDAGGSEDLIQQIHVAKTESGLKFFEIRDERYAEEDSILNGTCRTCPHFWIVNFKMAGISSDVAGDIPDLLEDFPDEIRKQNSLHIVSFGSELAKRYIMQLVDSDCAIGFASELSIEEIAQAMKFQRAWFLSGKNLEFHLRNGSTELHQNLFGCLPFLLIFDEGDPSCFRLFFSPNSRLSWEDIGFPFMPTEN